MYPPLIRYICHANKSCGFCKIAHKLSILLIFIVSINYRSDRQAKQDIDIKGVHIPKGTIVGIPIYAIHHNPEVWPQPDKFDPERFGSYL